MSKVPYFVAYGGSGTVTGSNFLISDDETNVVVDCGITQGLPNADISNQASFDYKPETIKYVCITHAHMDHIGRLPKLVRDGFSGVIYSTHVTKELARLMFNDAISLMERADVPFLYERKDVEKALLLWKTIPYHEKVEINKNISFLFLDAGHILGSAMVEFLWNDKKIVFTGDLGNSPSLLLRDTEKLSKVDYLLMESTYGDRNHEGKTERAEKFKNILEKTINRGGTVVIPSFSLERTQEMLYELNEFIEGKQIKSVPVFVDSPLASRVTGIYKDVVEHYKEEVKKDIASGDKIFDFPRLMHTVRRADSESIKETMGAKIIIAGSGMSSGGRVRAHETQYLPNEQNTILFVGYQGVGTLGRELVDGARNVSIDGVNVPVRAEIAVIQGYSSHKDSDALVDFVANTADSLKKVFVAIGEPKASLFLIQKLRDSLGVNAVYTEAKNKYFLE